MEVMLKARGENAMGHFRRKKTAWLPVPTAEAYMLVEEQAGNSGAENNGVECRAFRRQERLACPETPHSFERRQVPKLPTGFCGAAACLLSCRHGVTRHPFCRSDKMSRLAPPSESPFLRNQMFSGKWEHGALSMGENAVGRLWRKSREGLGAK
jgi:hypothetical protein